MRFTTAEYGHITDAVRRMNEYQACDTSFARRTASCGDSTPEDDRLQNASMRAQLCAECAVWDKNSACHSSINTPANLWASTRGTGLQRPTLTADTVAVQAKYGFGYSTGRNRTVPNNSVCPPVLQPPRTPPLAWKVRIHVGVGIGMARECDAERPVGPPWARRRRSNSPFRRQTTWSRLTSRRHEMGKEN